LQLIVLISLTIEFLLKTNKITTLQPVAFQYFVMKEEKAISLMVDSSTWWIGDGAS